MSDRDKDAEILALMDFEDAGARARFLIRDRDGKYPDLSDAVLADQGTANARLLHPLRTPIADPGQIARLDVRRRDRLGSILHEYEHAA